MGHDCDVENLRVQTKNHAGVQNRGCRSDLTPTNRGSKGQSMGHDCDVKQLKIQGGCEAILCAKESRSRSNTLIKSLRKASKFDQKY